MSRQRFAPIHFVGLNGLSFAASPLREPRFIVVARAHGARTIRRRWMLLQIFLAQLGTIVRACLGKGLEAGQHTAVDDRDRPTQSWLELATFIEECIPPSVGIQGCRSGCGYAQTPHSISQRDCCLLLSAGELQRSTAPRKLG